VYLLLFGAWRFLAQDRAAPLAVTARAIQLSQAARLSGLVGGTDPETLAAHGDQRTVVTDNTAGMFAAAPCDALIAKDDAVIAKTTYREWLAR
jgi:hypothetical protein